LHCIKCLKIRLYSQKYPPWGRPTSKDKNKANVPASGLDGITAAQN